MYTLFTCWFFPLSKTTSIKAHLFFPIYRTIQALRRLLGMLFSFSATECTVCNVIKTIYILSRLFVFFMAWHLFVYRLCRNFHSAIVCCVRDVKWTADISDECQVISSRSSWKQCSFFSHIFTPHFTLMDRADYIFSLVPTYIFKFLLHSCTFYNCILIQIIVFLS